jgi:hypothetical protein
MAGLLVSVSSWRYCCWEPPFMQVFLFFLYTPLLLKHFFSELSFSEKKRCLTYVMNNTCYVLIIFEFFSSPFTPFHVFKYMISILVTLFLDHISACFMGTDHCKTNSEWVYLCMKQTCEIPCELFADVVHSKSWYSWCKGFWRGTCNCKICYDD